MESEQVINADKVKTDASQADMQTISNNMDGDCRETVESVEGEPMQQTVKSSVTTSVDVGSARVELTDANSSENVAEDETKNIKESGSADAVDNNATDTEQVEDDANDSAKSENVVELENDDDGLENVDIQKPAESVEKETKQTGERAVDDDEPEEIPDDEDTEEEVHRSEDDESCEAAEDNYADDDSHEAVDGEHDDIQEVSGSEVSQGDEDEAGHDIEEYDSDEDREEHEREEDGNDEPEEEDDDDVAVISDTSEEERNEEEEDMDQDEHEDSREDDSKVCEQLYDSDEVESEMSDDVNEDDDDLMDEIISRRTEKHSSYDYRKESKRGRQKEKKFKNAKVEKRSWFCDWRLKLKKRSFKWLKAARMRHVIESQGDVNVLDYIVSNVTSTPNKIQNNPDHPSPFIITQVTSIATDKVLTTSPQAGAPHLPEPRLQTSEMQQINKIQDCVKKSSQDECQEIKHQSCNQAVQQDNHQRGAPLDENNKENIGNNEKKKEDEPKVNGTPSYDGPTNIKSSQQIGKKEIVDIDESDEMEIMEISDEPSAENSSYESNNETVIDTKEKECMEDIVKESSKCDINSIPIKADKKEEIERRNEEIKKESSLHSHHNNIEQDTSNKSQSKELHPNEHSDPPKSISPKSCMEKDSVEKIVPANEVKSDAVKSPSNQQNSEIAPQSSESINKRSRSPAQEDQLDSEDVHPAKKLKSRIDANFATHDEILNDYVERTSNNSVDEIQKHLGQLIVEIQTLNDMIKAKEVEWNNLLHLKKVKEEICLRLTRKKQVMDILTTKVGQVNDGGGDNNMVGTVMEHLNSIASDLNNSKIMSSAVYAATGSSANTLVLPVVSTPMANSKTLSAVAASSTPNNTSLDTSLNHAHMTANLLNNLSNISAISVSGLQPQSQAHQQNSNTTAGGNSIVQNILQSRANMKSSDLVKEKATTQRLHRNILPKPSTITTAASATAATINGDSSSNSVGISLLPKLSAAPLNATKSPSVPSVSISGANVPINLSSSSNANSAQRLSTGNDHQPILNNYLTASATATIQKQLGEMLNGHHNFRSAQEFNAANGGQPLGFGRQGAFKDVKSIIADYRQKHPEAVPRRGRRVKNSSSMGNLNQLDSATILGNVLKSESRGSTDLSALFAKIDGNSRPSSNDSSHSATNINNNIISGNMSFKDVLIQFAKMNEQNNAERPHMNTKGGQSNASNAPFPEVTLHPVTSMHSSLEQGAGSLLHGILTKYNRPNVSSSATNMQPTSTTSTSNYNSSFSPTLARLLTAPDRITTATNSLLPSFQQTPTSGNSSNTLNISKMVTGANSEITITPVMSGQQVPTLLQQQLEHQHQQHQLSMKRDRIKLENLLNAKDDEADDSIDRLVIDEGGDSSMGAEENLRIAPNAFGLEFNENEVPACQGCKKNEAQFVCAGCANQLYCSRECQVAAWDEHSEVCTG